MEMASTTPNSVSTICESGIKNIITPHKLFRSYSPFSLFDSKETIITLWTMNVEVGIGKICTDQIPDPAQHQIKIGGESSPIRRGSATRPVKFCHAGATVPRPPRTMPSHGTWGSMAQQSTCLTIWRVDSWCHCRLFRGPSTPQGQGKHESLDLQLSDIAHKLLLANAQLISGPWCDGTSLASNAGEDCPKMT